MDPTQATVHLLIVLTSRIQKSGAGDTNFSNEKAHFSLANQNDQTGHNGPPSMAVTKLIFQSDQSQMVRSIRFLTKILG